MSTTCGINLELTKVKDDLLKGINPLEQIKDNLEQLSNIDIAKLINQVSDYFETSLVDGTALKLNKGLLDSSGKVSRYVYKGTSNIAFKGRATDTSKLADLKKWGADVRTESEKSDNIIKAEKGTVIHAAAQFIMNSLIREDKSGLIWDSKETLSDKSSILAMLHSNPKKAESIYNALEKGVKEIFEQIKEKQRLVDPTKQAIILTEKMVFDTNTGSTMDLFYMLSNKKAGVFDYKSITPYNNSLLDDEGNLISDKWISSHKQMTMNLQMSKIAELVKTSLGIDLEMARIAPIQVHFEFKDKKEWQKGSILKNELSTLKIGKDESEFLKQIPMIVEKFDSKELNENLNKLLILKNNLLIEINATGKTAWKKKQTLEYRLRKVQSQINSLQVDKDLENIYTFYKELVDKYSAYETGSYKLKNIDDEYIEYLNDRGEKIIEKNPNYLTLEDIRDLEISLKTLLSILYSTEEFMKELNIKDKEKYDYFRQIEAQYVKRANYMLKELEETKLHRVLTSSQIKALKDSQSLGLLGTWTNRPSEQNNVIVQVYSNLMAEANNEIRIELQQFEKELTSYLLPLQQWAKQSGKKGFSMYDILIDKKTGNLYNSLKSDFFSMLKLERTASKSKTKSVREKAKKNILQYYTIKDNHEEIFEIMKENFIKNNQPDDKTLMQWEEKWNINSDNVVFENINTFYKLDYSKINDNYFTEEYKEIKKHKEVLDFYNFWEKSMYKFLHQLEVYGENHYSNFIPWIKAETSEILFREGLSATINEYKESLSLAMGAEHRTEDTEAGDKFVQGKINPGTGEEQRTVPRFFLNPIFNNEGQIDTTLKSFDLAKSLFMFANMAMNYKHKTKIETIIETLKDISLMEDAGIIAKDINTKFPGGDVHRLTGVQNEIYQYIDKMIKYNLYGVQFDMSDKTAKQVRWLFALDRYNKKRIFGLNINSAFKAQVASRLAMLFEGIKGIYFDRKMMSSAFDKQVKVMKDVATNTENLDFEIIKYFSPYAESITHDRTAKLSVDPTNSFLGMSTDDIINMLGRGDRAVDNTILLSIIQNYGIDNGKLIRLNKTDNIKGVKSLYETASIKDGKLSIPGIIENGKTENLQFYTQFRNIVLNVSSSIKGNINQEDMNMLGVNLLSRFFMSMRTFIPALAKERFQGISYNQVTKEITVGRYRALFQNIGKKQKDKLSSMSSEDAQSALETYGYIVKNGSKQILNFASMMLTYGLPNIVSLGYLSKIELFKFQKEIAIADHRSRAIFENYKAQYPNTPEIQNLSYEDFLDYKLKQIKTMSVEISVITAFLLVLNALKNMDLDDDDKKDYREHKALRLIYKQILGTYRELSFFVNPLDWTQNMQSISPLFRFVTDAMKLVINTGDETTDLIFGEDDKKDQTPVGYYTSRMIPYVNSVSRQIELFEQDKKVYW